MSDVYVHLSCRSTETELTEAPAPEAGHPEPVRLTLRLSVSSAQAGFASGAIAVPEPRIPHDTGSQPSTQLLDLADLVESWGCALPRWDSQVEEPWFEFVESAYTAETGLAARLRQLPTCCLSMCPVREQVSFALAGVSVHMGKGMTAACRAWARQARARAAV